jgi:hypothetical protein
MKLELLKQRKDVQYDTVQTKTTHFVAVSPKANSTDRVKARPAKLVSTSVGRGCCVVSAADPYGR